MYSIMLILNLLLANTCKCDNLEASKKFNEYLHLVEVRLNDKKAMAGLSNAVKQLRIVTDIDSGSDATYYGELNPTLEAFNAWKAWYEIYQDKLCWNNRKEVFWLND